MRAHSQHSHAWPQNPGMNTGSVKHDELGWNDDLSERYEEIPCRDVHLARCLQFAMHKFRLSLFVKDLEPGGSTTFCFLIV